MQIETKRLIQGSGVCVLSKELSEFEPRIRKLQRETLLLIHDIPKSKRSVSRNCERLERGFRLLLASLTMDKEIRVGESAVPEVAMPYQSLLPQWCTHNVTTDYGDEEQK